MTGLYETLSDAAAEALPEPEPVTREAMIAQDALLSFALAELARFGPARCWRCGNEIADEPDVAQCPCCGANLVPF